MPSVSQPVARKGSCARRPALTSRQRGGVPMIGTIRAFGATHAGRRRENNEDAFRIEESLCAAILADGMGGENCGEVGSAITVETIREYLRAPEQGLSSEERAKEAI